VRAAVYHGREDIRVETVPDPVPAAGELLIEVRVCGVCGTDAAEFALGPRMLPVETRHPASGHLGPMVPGHELAGRVVGMAADVEGFAEGQWVVSGAGVWCGDCRRCRAGRANHCREYWTVGLQRDGGLAELCAVPAITCLPAEPYGLEGDVLGLAQPMAIAVHSLRRGRAAAGETAVVIGVGGIGAFLVHALARTGLRVIVSDLDPERRGIARRLGAEVALDPAETSPAEALAAAGLEPDVVFEVTGNQGGLQAAIEALAPLARLVAVGLHERPRELDLRTLTLREHEVIGTNAHVCEVDLPEALRLLAGHTGDWRDVAPLALPLDRLVEDALRPLAEGRSERIKTLIDPWASEPRDTRMPDPMPTPTTSATRTAPADRIP
jgi:(R,R)-butanediol dehydrogenase / meso-butanediol dehydrogenase / diacetyl reductase